jgi:hypothetical protein
MTRSSFPASRNPPAIKAILVAVLLGVYACSSFDHKPDPAEVVQSTDCEIVNGRFRVRSVDDGRKLAGRVFVDDHALVTLELEKGGEHVILRGTTASGKGLEKDIAGRFSCNKSVLTLLLVDDASPGSLGMHTESMQLELFALDAGTLTLRFVDTELTFVFLLPVYSESDEAFVLERIEAVEP